MAIMEAIVLLNLSPIITRGTTAIIYHYAITTHVFKGRLVKLSSSYLSVEDLITRLISFMRPAGGANASLSNSHKVAISAQFMVILISLVMTFGIFVLNLFTDGATTPKYESRKLFLCNGAKFINLTAVADLPARAAFDVFGMSPFRSASVVNIGTVESQDSNFITGEISSAIK